MGLAGTDLWVQYSVRIQIVMYEGRDLYKWSYDQMYKIRKNKLTSEQVSKLKSIGVTELGR